MTKFHQIDGVCVFVEGLSGSDIVGQTAISKIDFVGKIHRLVIDLLSSQKRFEEIADQEQMDLYATGDEALDSLDCRFTLKRGGEDQGISLIIKNKQGRMKSMILGILKVTGLDDAEIDAGDPNRRESWSVSCLPTVTEDGVADKFVKVDVGYKEGKIAESRTHITFLSEKGDIEVTYQYKTGDPEQGVQETDSLVPPQVEVSEKPSLEGLEGATRGTFHMGIFKWFQGEFADVLAKVVCVHTEWTEYKEKQAAAAAAAEEERRQRELKELEEKTRREKELTEGVESLLENLRRSGGFLEE